MSNFGEFKEGVSCWHKWVRVDNTTNSYKCSNNGCMASCKRSKGKLIAYSLGIMV